MTFRSFTRRRSANVKVMPNEVKAKFFWRYVCALRGFPVYLVDATLTPSMELIPIEPDNLRHLPNKDCVFYVKLCVDVGEDVKLMCHVNAMYYTAATKRFEHFDPYGTKYDTHKTVGLYTSALSSYLRRRIAKLGAEYVPVSITTPVTLQHDDVSCQYWSMLVAEMKIMNPGVSMAALLKSFGGFLKQEGMGRKEYIAEYSAHLNDLLSTIDRLARRVGWNAKALRDDDLVIKCVLRKCSAERERYSLWPYENSLEKVRKMIKNPRVVVRFSRDKTRVVASIDRLERSFSPDGIRRRLPETFRA